MEKLLTIENLNVSYDDKPILRGVDMEVRKGEIVGIVGESGCGKSTTIYATLGILGKGGKVTNGSIRYGDTELLTLPKEKMRRLRGPEISLVAQNPMMAFHPVRKIGAQLRDMVKCHPGISYQEAEEKILEVMAKMNLNDGKRLLNSYTFELSGGMCQRVSIAMAMVLNPKLLLADEPTSALDVTVQKQVVEEMRRLSDEYGNSTMIVSHNMGVISHISDRVYVMLNGRVLEYGDKDAVIKNPLHPYTKNLIEAIPSMNKPAPKGIRITKLDRSFNGCPLASSCPHCNGGCQEWPDATEAESGHFVHCNCV